jgi:hypothetical protein
MIKFFRHIRQRMLKDNRISKYVLYAFGEIVLVVIGILLALQINNWNSKRLDHARNQKLLIKLSKELDLNIERASLLDSLFDNSFRDRFIFTDSLIHLMENNTLTSHLDYAVSEPVFYVNTFNLNTSVYEELKNTGSLYAVGTDSLVTEIQRYYQLCDRESFYNLNYSEGVNHLGRKCYEGWWDFNYLYRKNPEEAFKYHPWIKDPRSPHYINFRQYVGTARGHSQLMRLKLKGIIRESERLKNLIEIETKPLEQD